MENRKITEEEFLRKLDLLLNKIDKPIRQKYQPTIFFMRQLQEAGKDPAEILRRAYNERN